MLLGILGFFYYNCVVITSFSCRGACFYCGDVLLWIIIFGDVHFSGVHSIPPDISGVIGEVDLSGALSLELAGIIFSFYADQLI